jgi:hypothetical protein
LVTQTFSGETGVAKLSIAICLLMAGTASAAANLSLTRAESSAELSQETMPVFHNGSRAIFTRTDGHVEIRHDLPRPGSPVQSGTLLFSGNYDTKTGRYAGTAYVIKRGCEPAPYAVIGKESGPGIVMIGIAPMRDPRSCALTGETFNGKNARLVFEYERE